MESGGSQRRGLLTAGGASSIVGGIPQIVCSGVLIADYLASFPDHWLLIKPWFLPFFPSMWRNSILWGMFPDINSVAGIRWEITVGFIIILGIMAVIGGVSAIRRRSFGLSLAGAICALVWVPLGILAVIFVALGKREFRAKVKEDGI